MNRRYYIVCPGCGHECVYKNTHLCCLINFNVIICCKCNLSTSWVYWRLYTSKEDLDNIDILSHIGNHKRYSTYNDV